MLLLPRDGINTTSLSLLELLLQLFSCFLLLLAVVSHGQSDLLFENIVDADARPSLDLLLCALFMLLAHVHDRSRRRAVKLLTVHALKVFGDLIRHPSMLTVASRSPLTRGRIWVMLILVHIRVKMVPIAGLIRDFRDRVCLFCVGRLLLLFDCIHGCHRQQTRRDTTP